MSEKLHPVEAGLRRWYDRASKAYVDKTTSERIYEFITLTSEAVSRTGITLQFPHDNFEIVDATTRNTLAYACWNGSQFFVRGKMEGDDIGGAGPGQTDEEGQASETEEP